MLRYMLLALTLGYANAVLAQPTRVITVNEPPSSYLADDGKVSGYVVDIVRAMHRYMGTEPNIEVLPEARALKTALTNDNVAIFSFTKTAERDTALQWVGPIMRKSWYLIVRSDSHFESSNLADFDSIGVVRGDIRAVWAERQGLKNLKVASNHQQNMLFLAKGRVDAIIYNLSGARILSIKLGLAEDGFKNIAFIKTAPVYIGFSKKFKDYQEWQQAFDAIRDSGELAEITADWLGKLISKGILSHQRGDILSID